MILDKEYLQTLKKLLKEANKIKKENETNEKFKRNRK